MSTPTAINRLTPGQRVRLESPTKSALFWWAVRAANERYAILTRQATFRPKGELHYTILDVAEGVRGPCDRIGQGWDVEAPGGCQDLLRELTAGRVAISRRNNLPIAVLEVIPGTAQAWLTEEDYLGVRGVDDLDAMARAIAEAEFSVEHEIPATEPEIRAWLDRVEVTAVAVPAAIFHREAWDGSMVFTLPNLSASPGRGHVKVLGVRL